MVQKDRMYQFSPRKIPYLKNGSQDCFQIQPLHKDGTGKSWAA